MLRATGMTDDSFEKPIIGAVSYTHLRAHETVLDLVCRLLLEKKTADKSITQHTHTYPQTSVIM